MYASRSVLSRLGRRNESNATKLARAALAARRLRLSAIWRSWSVHDGTRKMVNYAWARRSQRKLWWRSAAVLTCKSIVKFEHRGESNRDYSGLTH